MNIKRSYKRKIAYNLLFLSFILTLLFLSSCAKKSKLSETVQDKEIAKEFPVMVETVTLRNLDEYINVSGTLEGKSDIVLNSETSGKVIQMYKKLGDWVDKGEALGRVDNSDYENSLAQAKASLNASEASYESSELSYRSSEELYKKNSISQSEFANARFNMKNAAANLEGAKARLEQARKAYNNSNFTSPVSGQIVDLPIQVGQTISIGAKIASIVDTRNLMIKTGVGESYITALKKGSPVEIIHQNSEHTYNALISGIGLKPLLNTANYPVEISLSNSQGLIPGMVVDAKILSKIYSKVIFTSYNNLIQEYDNYYMFTIDEKNIAHRTKVKIGKKVNESVIILEGLQLGDKIVIEGLENLETGTKVLVRN